ncbi:uncharacterized protein EI90DRAFT_1091084 [Cantharellus anzutake]|uniref:uncharacterized protein n=1 Tax=Cantharellus anzutake TaxID=1750568 RepID=UPI001908268B|nr:uncharacterized protein EI90DRAFT_1091084 [Cantharellus anzutake]KAF8330741.1 hypothetical protein EI90DRAFT_1091084 [Cantharellus anzutake]
MEAGRPHHQFEHLACFLRGPPRARRGDTWLGTDTRTIRSHWAAEGLTTSCHLVYAEVESGLGTKVAQMRIDVKTRSVKELEEQWTSRRKFHRVRTMASARRDCYIRNNVGITEELGPSNMGTN